jgi:hypothetical protein
MKKLLVLSLAVAMVVAFTLPASAFESVFGGYWRTRAVTEQRFSGENNSKDTQSPNDLELVDTRTRLYYTAVLNDNLQLINKFEWNNTWGSGPGGDYGADGTGILRIKQSYVSAKIGPVTAKIGEHDVTWARGFIYADEFSGVTLSFKAGDVLVPLVWMKGNEGGGNHNSNDVDILGLYPVFQFGEKFNLNPFIIYGYSKGNNHVLGQDSLSTYGANGIPANAINDGVGVYWVGTNADFTLGSVALWFTGAYQGGKLKIDNADDLDVKAGLLAGGASVPLGPVELHGQAFWTSGDGSDNDTDAEAFFGIGGGGRGWAYYWSEIMGLGVFDQQDSAGSTVDVSNLWAVNIGASINPIEKLKLTGDVWYAAHSKNDFTTDEKKLGTEVDLKADYQLIEGLNLTVVGAYLFADDATSLDGNNQEDPYEVGTQLSLSF